MAAAGLYTFGGSFWEFGEPDWEHTQYFMLFGVAEDHASNPIKIALGKLKAKGVKVVAVNPIRTGYGAIADEWIGIKPGTDGLFVGALIHELMRAQKVDLDYLVRFTNAPWLVIDDPGAADDGLFARDEDGKPLALDKTTGGYVDATRTDIAPALVGTFKLPDGRKARPAFALIAERFLGDEYSPDTVAAEPARFPPRRSGASPRELAHAAFEQQVTLDVPWTDTAGRRHEKTVGRPVSMHAMRGISAHANGFQTCRMLHLLQIVLGSIDCPGGFRYKAPFPRRCRPAACRRGPAEAPGQPLKGAPLGFVQGPEDLLVDADGKPLRIDKAYSWDAPIVRARPDAHGHQQRGAGRSLPGRRAVHVHGQHELEFVDEHSGGAEAPDRQGRGDRRIQNSEDHLLRRLFLGDGGLCRPDPAGHHLSGALGLHLAARPADLRPRWPGRRDPPAGGAAGPRRAAVPERADRPRRAAEAAGLRHRDRRAEISRAAIRTTSSITSAARASARWPAFAARTARATARARPIRTSSMPTSPTAASTSTTSRRSSATTSTPTRPIWNGPRHAGFIGSDAPIIFQLYLEPLQKFRLAARGHGAVQPPASHRERIETYFDPLPFWYPPFDGDAGDEFPFSAITQRPMHMYHSWGSHNGWLRQITAENCLYINRARARKARHRRRRLGLDQEPLGRVKGRVRLMEGVNADTVWTWNAVGRRGGAAALDQRRAGDQARLPAQPPDRRSAARARGRLPLLQQRSDHRPGGVVRPPRQHREGRAGRGRRELAAVRADALRRRTADRQAEAVS